MKRTLALSALLLVVAALGAAAAPRITVDSARYVYPDTVSGIAVTHTFVLSNVGDQDLWISGVDAACHCTTAALSSNLVPPGQSVALPVVFDTTEFIGEQDRKLEVLSNDPATPRLELHIAGRVLRRATYQKPAGAYLGEAFVLLDVRDASSFAAGHLIGAMNVPAAQASSVAATLPPSVLYWCYDQDETLLQSAASALRAGGLASVNLIDGGLSYFATRQPWNSLLVAGADSSWGRFLDVSGARTNWSSSMSGTRNISNVHYFVTIDLRSTAAFAAGHLVGAMNLAEASASAFVSGLPNDVPVLLYSDDGAASDRVADAVSRVHSQTTSLLGGFVEWQRQYGNLFVVASIGY